MSSFGNLAFKKKEIGVVWCRFFDFIGMAKGMLSFGCPAIYSRNFI
jgi:hypothetical protein